jgi:hypothetical protein
MECFDTGMESPPEPASMTVDITTVPASAKVDLLWIPLGAGGHVVQWNGKLYEALSAWRERRPRQDLYHSALEVAVPEGRFVIEQTPIPDRRGHERGVVGEGPVGTRWAERFRIFRYEIRRWQGGVIPDADEAVATVRVTDDLGCAQRILDLVPSVPTPVWGRDELGAGEMWNSNSMISWLLDRAGLDTDKIGPPDNGRAPGWVAGLVVARRSRPDRRTRPISGRADTSRCPGGYS